MLRVEWIPALTGGATTPGKFLIWIALCFSMARRGWDRWELRQAEDFNVWSLKTSALASRVGDVSGPTLVTNSQWWSHPQADPYIRGKTLQRHLVVAHGTRDAKVSPGTVYFLYKHIVRQRYREYIANQMWIYIYISLWMSQGLVHRYSLCKYLVRLGKTQKTLNKISHFDFFSHIIRWKMKGMINERWA